MNGALGTFNADIHTWSHSHMATVNAKTKVIFLANSFVPIFKRNMFLLFMNRYQQYIYVLLQAMSLSQYFSLCVQLKNCGSLKILIPQTTYPNNSQNPSLGIPQRRENSIKFTVRCYTVITDT